MIRSIMVLAFVLAAYQSNERSSPVRPEVVERLMATISETERLLEILASDPGYRAYDKMPGNRAVAVAVDPDSGFITRVGYSAARETARLAAWEAIRLCGRKIDGVHSFECRLLTVNTRFAFPTDPRDMSTGDFARLEIAAQGTPAYENTRPLVVSVDGVPHPVQQARYSVSGGDMRFAFDSDASGGACVGGTDRAVLDIHQDSRPGGPAGSMVFYYQCGDGEPVMGKMYGTWFERKMLLRAKAPDGWDVTLRFEEMDPPW